MTKLREMAEKAAQDLMDESDQNGPSKLDIADAIERVAKSERDEAIRFVNDKRTKALQKLTNANGVERLVWREVASQLEQVSWSISHGQVTDT